MNDTLADRIWSCVPVTGQAFAALLSLLEIEESTDIPTACVTTGAHSRLLVNPGFVAAHCRTDAHLAMLVLHELYHVLLGHTRLFARVTPAQNWAFDCLINAQLCRLFPQPGYTSFFTQFVRGEGGVGDLLAPPRHWDADSEAWRKPAVRKRAVKDNPRLGDAHWRLYSDDSITTEELYALLPRLFLRRGEGSGDAGDGADSEGEFTDVTLLGDHGDGGGEGAALHPQAMREVRDIIARWPIVERRSGRDQGAVLHEERLTPGERRSNAVAVLRRALARLAGSAGAGSVTRPGMMPVDTILPFDTGRDRRAIVQQASGHEPLLFAGTAVARAATPIAPVRVYLDVSGSMDNVLEPLYAALAGCLEQIDPVIYGFSTEIGALTHAQLRAGVRLTNGGTSIDAVTAHLLKSKARRALIVTDGWVGRIPEQHLHKMRKRGVLIAAAVTDGGDQDFATLAGYPVFQLPSLSK